MTKKIKILLIFIINFLILIPFVGAENSNTGSLVENKENSENQKIKNSEIKEKEKIKQEEKKEENINENNEKIKETEKKSEKTKKNQEEEKTIKELEKEIVGSKQAILEEEKLKKLEKKETNIVIDAYKTRRQQVFDMIKKSPIDQKIDDVNEIIKNIQTEKKLNEKLYEKLKQDIKDFDILKKEILEKEEEIKKLEEIKDKNKEQIEKLKKEQELKIKYKILANNRKKEIEIKQKAIEQSKEEIKNKEGLEERYKILKDELVKEKLKNSKIENKRLMSKLNVLYIFGAIIFLLYLLRFLILNHTNFKRKHTKIVTVGELALGIIIVVFGIWYFFYLFPNLYILVIFLSGYLLLVNAHLIASFMGSLIVVNKYSVGDVVKTGDYLGKIEKIGTVYTVISEIDEKGFMHKNYKYIPNVIIVKEGLEKVKDHILKQRTFEIKLQLNKQNTIFKIIEHIKNNILLKFINSRPQHLDPKNNDVFEIKYEQEKVGEVKITFFWFSTEEVSKKIKSRIIGYIEKETCQIEENNFDDDEEKEEKKEEKNVDDLKFIGV